MNNKHYGFVGALMVAVATMGAMIPSAVQAADAPVLVSPTISTGSPEKNYYRSFGPNLAAAMYRASGYNKKYLMPTVIQSGGSIDNANNVASGVADLGLTQADAQMQWRADNPNESNKVRIVAAIPGVKECVFAVVSTTSQNKIKRLTDLKKGSSINIGEIGSGSVSSWAYIHRFLPEASPTRIEYESNVSALGSVQTGAVDAMIFVSAIDRIGEIRDMVYANEDSGVKFIDIDDDRLSEKLPNGKRVYDIEEVQLESGFMPDTVKVPCTSLLVIGSATGKNAINDAAARAIFNEGESISAIRE